MLSRTYFRQSGYVAATRRDRLADWGWIATAMAFIVLLLGYADARDQLREAELDGATACSVVMSFDQDDVP